MTNRSIGKFRAAICHLPIGCGIDQIVYHFDDLQVNPLPNLHKQRFVERLVVHYIVESEEVLDVDVFLYLQYLVTITHIQ